MTKIKRETIKCFTQDKREEKKRVLSGKKSCRLGKRELAGVFLHSVSSISPLRAKDLNLECLRVLCRVEIILIRGRGGIKDQGG